MAATTGLISSRTSTFFSGETSSFISPPFSSPSSSLRFAPANLRMVRIPTLATASKPATTTPREPRGIMKPRKVSPEMQALVGAPEISRTQALKQIWAHIKQNNLQKLIWTEKGGGLGEAVLNLWDPQNKRIIVCDEKLKKIFAGKDRVGFLEVAGLITPHFL